MNTKSNKDNLLKRYSICEEAKKLKQLLSDFNIPFEEKGCNEWYGRRFYGIHYPEAIKDWNSEITVSQDDSLNNQTKRLTLFIDKTNTFYKDISATEAFEIIKEYHLKRLQENLEKAQNALDAFMSI